MWKIRHYRLTMPDPLFHHEEHEGHEGFEILLFFPSST
jgi:hypothetical protein